MCCPSPYRLGKLVLCTILVRFVPLLLGESLLQYHWNVLCAVRVLFIPYCLGNSCSHFILGRLVSCARRSLATFYSGLLLVFVWSIFCVLVLHFLHLARLCRCPFSWGHLSWSTIGLHHPYSNLVGVFSAGRLSLCHFILGISSGAPLCWFPSIHTPACWSYCFRCVSLICLLALGVFSGLLLCCSSSSLLQLIGVIFLDTFLRFAHLLRHYLSGSLLEPLE